MMSRDKSTVCLAIYTMVINDQWLKSGGVSTGRRNPSRSLIENEPTFATCLPSFSHSMRQTLGQSYQYVNLGKRILGDQPSCPYYNVFVHNFHYFEHFPLFFCRQAISSPITLFSL